jgi:hypothetical protein
MLSATKQEPRKVSKTASRELLCHMVAAPEIFCRPDKNDIFPRFLNVQMTTTLTNHNFVLVLFWAVHRNHWQNTHSIKDASMQPSSECCVCFEATAPQRDPCVHCGGSLPVCERCLHAWSWAAGSVKRCVVCRSEDLRPSRESRRIDLHLHPMSPLSCLFTISTYVFLHYSWLLCCYRIATSSFLF